MARNLLLCGFLGIYAVEVGAPDPANLLGGDQDDFGCVSSAGYTWCESQLKCLRTWEDDCTSEVEDDSAETLGADVESENGSTSPENSFESGDLVDSSAADESGSEDDDIQSGSSSFKLVLSENYVSVNSSNSSSNSSSEDDGYWYYYDRKARVREWLVQFFSVAGPLFVCVPLWALYLKRRRKRRALRQRFTMVQMNGNIPSDYGNYVVKETIAVREKRNATGQDYEHFSTRV